jgi:hypothetical protein
MGQGNLTKELITHANNSKELRNLFHWMIEKLTIRWPLLSHKRDLFPGTEGKYFHYFFYVKFKDPETLKLIARDEGKDVNESELAESFGLSKREGGIKSRFLDEVVFRIIEWIRSDDRLIELVNKQGFSFSDQKESLKDYQDLHWGSFLEAFRDGSKTSKRPESKSPHFFQDLIAGFIKNPMALFDALPARIPEPLSFLHPDSNYYMKFQLRSFGNNAKLFWETGEKMDRFKAIRHVSFRSWCENCSHRELGANTRIGEMKVKELRKQKCTSCGNKLDFSAIYKPSKDFSKYFSSKMECSRSFLAGGWPRKTFYFKPGLEMESLK